MRAFLLASALLATAASALSVPADAAARHHRSMSVKLASGRMLTLNVVRYRGQMMAMIPVGDILNSDVFNRS